MDNPAAGVFDELPRPVEEDMSPGTVFEERYQVVELVGRSGMSAVYLAQHVEVGNRVAIKVLHTEPSARASIARRFRGEACKAGSLGHPHIVEVFDAGVLPDGRLFLVMEYLEGHDLAHELDEVLVFDAERACILMRQVALALAAAHGVGIVHRDIKPSNVLLVPGPEGTVVKLLDFGLAANVSLNAGSGEHPTEAGAHRSSADYMAPQQATSVAPTPASDVYAVGVMLYEMLTGSLPFTARHAFELMTFKLLHPAPSIDARRPGLPPRLVKLIADCLSIDPAARPVDGDALVTRLDEVLADLRRPHKLKTRGMAVAAFPAEPAERGQPSLLRPIALAVGVALALGGVFMLVPSDEAFEAEPAAERPPSPEPAEIHALPAVVPAPPPPALDPPPAPTPAPRRPDAGPRTATKRPAATAAPPEPAPSEPAPPTTAVGDKRDGEEHLTPRCQRVRARADEARRTQRWSQLRDQSRHRECWAADADVRKLQTKAAMELNDFSGCLSFGAGLKDQEVQEWLKLCKMRSDE